MGREEAVYVHDLNLRVKRAKIRNLRIVTPLLGARSGKATGSALPLYVKRYPLRLARPAELAALRTCSSESPLDGWEGCHQLSWHSLVGVPCVANGQLNGPVAVTANRRLAGQTFVKSSCAVCGAQRRPSKKLNVRTAQSLPAAKRLFRSDQIAVLGGENGVICNIIILVRCRLHSLSLGLADKKGWKNG
jgi:hypothetical protein